MFSNSISEWTERYGSVTIFTYMAYGEIEDEEIEVLGTGLRVFLSMEGVSNQFKIAVNEVWIEEALAMKEYRGNSIKIILTNDVPHLENIIKTVVGQFLETVAIKNNFIKTEVVSSLA